MSKKIEKKSQPTNSAATSASTAPAEQKRGESMEELKFESINNGSGSSTRYLKAAELADITIVGTFEGSYDGKFGVNHKFKLLNGDDVVVNGFGALNSQITRIEQGDLVKLVYEGKKKIKDGPMKGKDAHSVDVQRAKKAA